METDYMLTATVPVKMTGGSKDLYFIGTEKQCNRRASVMKLVQATNVSVAPYKKGDEKIKN